MTPPRSTLALSILLLTAGLDHEAARAHEGTLLPFVELPPGFGPEGIAAGPDRLYVGGLRDGSVITVDPRTGAAHGLVPAVAGRFALGMDLDERSGNLFVAGGPSGHLYVYDAATGALRADFLASGAFTNGVVVTHRGVYVTDSVNPVLYELPLGPGGALPAPEAVRRMPLTGDFPTIARAFNANGIAATPDGKDLIVVHTAAGRLFHVDPATGSTSAIDLAGGSVPNGDGLWLRGRTLYVLQNLSNQIAVVTLARDLTTGAIVRTITDGRFDVITSAARFGDTLYLTNARYTTRPTPQTVYALVGVPLAEVDGR